MLLYKGRLHHMWFIVLKSVYFRILQSGIIATMFKFVSAFLSFDKVWASTWSLPGLHLSLNMASQHSYCRT
jgi:hypothetical protein